MRIGDIWSVTWLRVGDDLDVDFFATRPGGPPLLVPVSMDTAADATWGREIRALEEAARGHPDAKGLLVTQDPTPPRRPPPSPVEGRNAVVARLIVGSRGGKRTTAIAQRQQFLSPWAQGPPRR